MSIAYKISPTCEVDELKGEYSLLWVDSQDQQWEGRLVWRERIGRWYLDMRNVTEDNDPVETTVVTVGKGQGVDRGVVYEHQLIVSCPTDQGQCEVGFDDLGDDRVQLMVLRDPDADVDETQTRVSAGGWQVVRE